MSEILKKEEEKQEHKVLQSVSLNKISDEIKAISESQKENKIVCLKCDKKFPYTEDGTGNPILAHLLKEHKIVIAEVQNIPNFARYINLWKTKFDETEDLQDICIVVKTNSGPEDKDEPEFFYMLTEFIPEDEAIREKLIMERLENILEVQQSERKATNFKKSCLFCKEEFYGNRAKIFRHMAKDHSFNIGSPDNIVHASEFLDLMKSKLDKFTCLCCEKDFKDWNILKDHMRKKGHKRISPKNKEYDKFYMINYLKPGKYWKEVQSEYEYEKEEENEEQKDIEQEWADWTEKKTPISLCLFCTSTDYDVNNIVSHMKVDHEFDLNAIRKKLGLNFYHQVKIVNYIRKMVYLLKCPHCVAPFTNRGELELHLAGKRHCLLPGKKIWDDPSYFFPTFDDDSLLCFLQDDNEDENQNITQS